MDKSSIEQKIKDRLFGHEMSTDKTELYQALGIEKKPRRKGLIFLIILGVGLFGLAGVLQYSTYLNDKNEQNEISEINETLPDDELKNHDMVSQEDRSKEEMKVNSTRMELQKDFAAEKKENLRLINNEVIINPETIENKEAFISQENLFPQNENQYKDNYLIDVTNGIKIDQRVHENKDDSPLVRSSIEMQSLRLWDIQDFDVSNEIQFTGELSNISDSSESNADLKNENIRKSISLYSSYYFFNHSIKGKTNVDELYASLRIDSETALENITSGFMFQYNLQSGLYFGVGLEYSQFNSRIAYSESLYRGTKDSVITTVRYNYIGDSTFIYGVPEEEMIHRKWTAYNSLSLIQTPIIMGYKKKFNSIVFNVESGISVGIYSIFRGKLANENLEVTEINNHIKKQGNLSFMFSGGIEFPVKNSLSVFSNLSYRQSLNNWTKSSYSLNEMYYLYGIQVGIRKDLF